MKTTIGGDRLGSGNKQEVSLKNFGRSTHDLSYIWRSSMSAGTLVPFMTELALPGDSFDIDLECDVKTLPTVGPLFGSYKVQLDVFECPIRLYQGKLHMNMLNIGMDMSEIHLPQMEMGAYYENTEHGDNEQVNASSIYSYLNVRGLGRTKDGNNGVVKRHFNAVPYLGYWQIYKQYYANKMEKDGVVIHQKDLSNEWDVDNCWVYENDVLIGDLVAGTQVVAIQNNMKLVYRVKWGQNTQVWGNPDGEQLRYVLSMTSGYAVQNFANMQVDYIAGSGGEEADITFTGWQGASGNFNMEVTQTEIPNTVPAGEGEPQLKEFPLDNIDTMQEDILKAVSDVAPFNVDWNSNAPYGLGLDNPEHLDDDSWKKAYAKQGQEGLGVKTYQSDLFNNWINTQYIDGVGGIADVTAIDTSGGDFTIDTLNLSQKVYNMLNRIAVSGGTYDDWLDAVYSHERAKSVESPVYHGSLIKELGFEEVISNADTKTGGEIDQPLGTLAGRGRLTGKNKGGKIKIKVSEPSYIIGIVSLTPKIDQSQGNKWDMSLKTMNDLHKPNLDEIGYQELITDQMSFWDTTIDNQTQAQTVEYKSAGKQPAWINYMTNVNQTRGNFAEKNKEMFMTLNRRYECGANGIEDVTTYIDPSLFNYIFAQTKLDSQNFWVQIGNNIKARRKMSAKVIPNL